MTLLIFAGLCLWIPHPSAAGTSSRESYVTLPPAIPGGDRFIVLSTPTILNSLGIRYARGKGVARNERMAMKFFLRSAEQGYTPAMANIGTLYITGVAGHPNLRRAYAWVRTALSFGVPEEDHDATVLKLGMLSARLGHDRIESAERLASVISTRIVETCECSPGQATEFASNDYQ